MEATGIRRSAAAFLTTFIVLTQGNGGLARSHLPFLPTDEGITVNDMVSRSLGLPDKNGLRRPRHVVSVLSLLWPQVVGPIENGIIKEEGYDEIPKTPLEYKLDNIRERSHIESATREHVRDMLNHGMPAVKLSLQQMHALHQDIALFFDRHHHHLPLQALDHDAYHHQMDIHDAYNQLLDHVPDVPFNQPDRYHQMLQPMPLPPPNVKPGEIVGPPPADSNQIDKNKYQQ